jgi:hypothetical protein
VAEQAAGEAGKPTTEARRTVGNFTADKRG